MQKNSPNLAAILFDVTEILCSRSRFSKLCFTLIVFSPAIIITIGTVNLFSKTEIPIFTLVARVQLFENVREKFLGPQCAARVMFQSDSESFKSSKHSSSKTHHENVFQGFLLKMKSVFDFEWTFYAEYKLSYSFCCHFISTRRAASCFKVTPNLSSLSKHFSSKTHHRNVFQGFLLKKKFVFDLEWTFYAEYKLSYSFCCHFISTTISTRRAASCFKVTLNLLKRHIAIRLSN